MAVLTKKEWHIDVDGIIYDVVFEKKKVSINCETPIPLIKYKKFKGGMLESGFEIPLGNKLAVLWQRGNGVDGPVLTMDGRNVENGEVYEPIVVPKWIWVFNVLYIINFFLVIGGALGGALNAGFAYITASVAANKKKSTITRVLICTGIYLGITAVSVVIVAGVNGLLK